MTGKLLGFLVVGFIMGFLVMPGVLVGLLLGQFRVREVWRWFRWRDWGTMFDRVLEDI